jgi:hypothetical protein
MINIYLFDCHKNFKDESLILRIIESIQNVEYTEKISKADLIITGPQGLAGLTRTNSPANFIRQHLNKLSVGKTISKNQLSLHVSHEAPNLGFADDSQCDYSICSEFSDDKSKILRMPYWFEALDWSDYELKNYGAGRAGVLGKPRELTQKRDTRRLLCKQKKLAIFSTHMNGIRKSVYDNLRKKFIIEGYGPFFDKSIEHHSKSPFTKYKILTNYIFNLCPENTLFPGYCTEKIVEAYCCNTIPITLADPLTVSYDFNKESIINLYEGYLNMHEYLIEIIENQQKIESIACEPLFKLEPTLDHITSFLRAIIK